jgi:hypothetical protein
MGYIGARDSFEKAIEKTKDPAIKELAEGLIDLSRAIEDDIGKLEREVKNIKSRV